MAVRTINYTVSESSVSPETSQWGGIQYENNATRVAYTLEQNFKERIEQNYPQAAKLVYRIDFDSSVAGYQPSENIEEVDGVISRDIPLVITASGEPFQSTLVITVLDSGLNEIGTLCSKPTRIYFNSISREQYSEEELTSSISAMEESVSKMHEQVLTSAAATDSDAKTAHEAMLKTEQAKLSLEGGSEFVFLGGDAHSAMEIEFVVDGEISDKSENPVKNKVISAAINDTKMQLKDYADSNIDTAISYAKQELIDYTDNNIADAMSETKQELKNYTDNKIADLDFIKEDMADYIVEQGQEGNWTYRKWNNGEFEAWLNETTAKAYTVKSEGSLYSTNDIAVTSPSFTKSIDFINCNCGFSGWIGWCTGWGEEMVVYRVYTTTDISAISEEKRKIRQFIYIKGTWEQEE